MTWHCIGAEDFCELFAQTNLFILPLSLRTESIFWKFFTQTASKHNPGLNKRERN